MIKNGQQVLRIVFLAEIVTHNQNDVNIVGRRLYRDVAAKQNKTLKLPRAPCDLVDAQQPVSRFLALRRAVTELLDDILDRGWMNAEW